ncbi:MAG: tRNA (adenosine(37)-N6)-dimethylallyltransferase MiaA [Planctomycetota bacterium]
MIHPPLIDRAIVLTGPTASGKSTLSIALAEAWNASTQGRSAPMEIVSVDSVAVYRGMDIGSAKPTASDRGRVPHHLLDIVDPCDEFSIAEYLDCAHQCVTRLHAEGRVPLLVGGTPLYLKALLRGFDPGPPPDDAFRQACEADIKTHGSRALWERVNQVDPLAAHRIEVADTRRLIRALEFRRVTGTPISHHQLQFEASVATKDACAFAVMWPREDLKKRIATRVAEMMQLGFVDEVRGLMERHGHLSKTARQSVGYREIMHGFESRASANTLVAEITRSTQRLAKRQMTWLRSFSELRSLDGANTSANLLGDLIEAIASWRSRSRHDPGALEGKAIDQT